jgi:hypothetical protein
MSTCGREYGDVVEWPRLREIIRHLQRVVHRGTHHFHLSGDVGTCLLLRRTRSGLLVRSFGSGQLGVALVPHHAAAGLDKVEQRSEARAHRLEIRLDRVAELGRLVL